MWLAVALEGQGKPEESEAAVRQAIAAKPQGEAAAWGFVAMRLVIVGKPFDHCAARAVDLAKRGIQLAPGR